MNNISSKVYTLYALFWFAFFTLLAFPLVLIFSLFGKRRGGNMIWSMAKIWADCWYFLLGIHHENIFESAYNSSGNYIFLANHISYMDIPCIFKAIRKQPVRVLGKEEIKKIPVFGYIYSQGAVMVDRGNTERRAKSVRILKSLLKHHISIFIFPEGTFNETGNPLKAFYDGAFRIAIETQTPVKPVLFLDNYTIMNYKSLLGLKHAKSRAVFLEEISPEGYTLKQISLYKKKVFDHMEEKLRLYHAAWIIPA
ncbi:MAG TPA: lysophospholipid acyltransferase family protein [Puia sp.]|jgi:1-acyl-sn-glycerol-3-phosphate acyltransferase|nr:lysophospholipid acyltransferase family protein [Puia sp.]